MDCICLCFTISLQTNFSFSAAHLFCCRFSFSFLASLHFRYQPNVLTMFLYLFKHKIKFTRHLLTNEHEFLHTLYAFRFTPWVCVYIYFVAIVFLFAKLHLSVYYYVWLQYHFEWILFIQHLLICFEKFEPLFLLTKLLENRSVALKKQNYNIYFSFL